MMRSKWNIPVFNEKIHLIYSEVYEEDSKNIISVMENSPDEIAVLSTLATYLNKKLIQKKG